MNCATIVHADTEVVIETLQPTGQTAGGPGPLGLVLDKVVDAANQREHFIYYGALIPGLQLPCGVPLRLLLDNGWQSPRFLAVAELAGPPDGVSASYQRLEWRHSGPLDGVPYGTGLSQRLYVLNGGLQYAAPREVEQSTQEASTGLVRQDFIAEYARRTTTAGLLPRYLADAVAASRTHKVFTVDNRRWKVQEVKEQAAGTDGGRYTMTLTLEDVEPLQSRFACPPSPLAPEIFDPVADAPRGYHCGDTSDTVPDYQPTGVSSCEVVNGANTGYLLSETEDVNPYSPTVGQPGPIARTLDTTTCPPPVVYQSVVFYAFAAKNDCPTGQTGSTVQFTVPAGMFQANTQADADKQAQDYADANKQAYANANGTCSTTSPGTYYPTYLPNGCFSGQMVNSSNPNDVRGATQAEYNQYMTGLNGSDGNECPLYN